MVKSIHFGYCPLSQDDYGVVVEFFRSIGCDVHLNAKGFAGFIAPRGTLLIRALRHGQPFEQQPSPAAGISIEVSNPGVVRNIADSMRLKVVTRDGDRSFSVELPGPITVFVQAWQEELPPEIKGGLGGSGKKFAVVISRFNSFITERLLQGTIDGLTRSGVKQRDLNVVRVPGSFEIPSAARTLAETRKYDAIICLGCLLRGDTAHYDVIVNEVTRGIGQSAQETGVPHAFGVLTCDTLEQAIDRAGLKMGNKGFEAALAAVEMANLKKAISFQPSAVRKSVISHQRSRISKSTSSKRRAHARKTPRQ
jgi:6,7-dimethyl-8-ribityllumazine synthase